MSLDLTAVSPVHVWRQATGGGTGKAYLSWLAAKWELFIGLGAVSTFDLHLTRDTSAPAPLRVRAQRRLREDFNEWLLVRYASLFDPVEEA